MGLYKVVLYKAIQQMDLIYDPTGFEGYGSSLAGISTTKRNEPERFIELPISSKAVDQKEKKPRWT